jgi:glucose-1-phosphate adenylyltransferase
MAVDYCAPADYLASMDIFVISKTLFRQRIEECIARNLFHMDRDLVLGSWQAGTMSVNVYQFRGLAMFNDSVEEYYRNSLALLDERTRHDLFYYNHPVYTRVRDRVPTYYGENANIDNCIVADGGMLEGSATNCILFRQVTISAGAEVSHCVVMNDCVIGEGAKVSYAILDKDVTVTPGAVICGTKNHPIVIKKGETV